MKVNEFLELLEELNDPRDQKKVLYSLSSIIFITLCAVLCGAESWSDVADFGEAKQDWLSGYVDLSNGIPSAWTFRRIFIILAPENLEWLLRTHALNIVSGKTEDQIAIDGKALRGSAGKGLRALQSVSAWSHENGVVLAETAVEKKSNEITAIPELLKILKLNGCTISIDAMGCQRDIVENIIEQKGDYVLGLKKNQPSLYEAVEKHMQEDAINHDHCLKDYFEEAHGRVTRRRYFSCCIKHIKESKKWTGLCAAVAVETITSSPNNPTQAEWRYYITSHDHSNKALPDYIRNHWGIENKLHWVLDVNLGEDADRKIERNSAKAFASLKRIALNIVRTKDAKSKRSLRRKFKCAGWDNNYLLNLLT
jgi:predicted transposase YbfD/YdcC